MSDPDGTSDRQTRRSLLAATVGVAVTGFGGCLGGDSSSERRTETVSDAAVADWLDDAKGHDVTVDRRGRETVQVEVGPESTTLGFVPAAVRVDPGTTVRWVWGADDTEHNVVGSNADFESDLTAEDGHEFTRQFDSPATVRYYCDPHRGLGMRGVVFVGDP